MDWEKFKHKVAVKWQSQDTENIGNQVKNQIKPTIVTLKKLAEEVPEMYAEEYAQIGDFQVPQLAPDSKIGFKLVPMKTLLCIPTSEAVRRCLNLVP